jgi:hypothetical protein
MESILNNTKEMKAEILQSFLWNVLINYEWILAKERKIIGLNI